MITRARDLPEDLELPLRTGRDWWYWTAGRPALDLVNTLRERWRRRVECLCGPDDLAEWLRRAGLLAGPVDVGGGLVEEARELREAIDAAASAVVAGGPAPEGAVAVIGRWLAAAAPPALEIDAGVPVLREQPGADPVRHALSAIALDAARMLGTAERERIRVCAAPDCSARFYDGSPAGRRRWCSMSGCGNRAKVRSHRTRQGTRTGG
ncbi:MAG: ABATE domain-containing protein [Thermoleophilia bacterium]